MITFVSLDLFIIIPCKSNIQNSTKLFHVKHYLYLFVSIDPFIIITCKSNTSSLKFFKHETVDVTLACHDDKRIQAHK